MIYERIIRRELVDKGWSGDQKYRAFTDDGQEYLLRISPVEKKDRRAGEFARMEQVCALGIPMCDPYEFGICDEGFYQILRWIDGEDAEPLIPTLSPEKQYAYGLDAGRILAKLHTLPPAPGIPEWEEKFNAKIDRKIAAYEACPLKYEGGEAFLRFLSENRHLLRNRPQTYQHGDFHIGNMMIADGKLVVIDFDRFDFGDPWEEFNRICWCAQKAPYFASGRVDGYFDGKVPREFWQLLAMYISSNTLSSVPWAIPFGEEQIGVILRQAKEVIDWYDGMKKDIPSWYKKPCEK